MEEKFSINLFSQMNRKINSKYLYPIFQEKLFESLFSKYFYNDFLYIKLILMIHYILILLSLLIFIPFPKQSFIFFSFVLSAIIVLIGILLTRFFLAKNINGTRMLENVCTYLIILIMAFINCFFSFYSDSEEFLILSINFFYYMILISFLETLSSFNTNILIYLYIYLVNIGTFIFSIFFKQSPKIKAISDIFFITLFFFIFHMLKSFLIYLMKKTFIDNYISSQ